MAIFWDKQTQSYRAQYVNPHTKKKMSVPGRFSSRRAAQQAMDKHVAQFQTSKMTIRELRDRWLIEGDKNWRISTALHYGERTKDFVEEFGDTRVVDFTRNQARAWSLDHPNQYGELRTMFGAALYMDNEHGEPLLTFNPFARVVRKKQQKRDLQADWMSNDTVVELEKAAEEVFPGPNGILAGAIIRFAAETGMRPGELYAAHYADADLEHGVMIVRQAWESKTGTMQLPKNGQRRQIALTDEAVEAVLRVERKEGSPWLFPTPKGTHFTAAKWAHYWTPIRAKVGRSDMVFYEMRHYCATRLLELGLSDADVAVQLGHKDGGKLVREVYGHPAERHALERVRKATKNEDADHGSGGSGEQAAA